MVKHFDLTSYLEEIMIWWAVVPPVHCKFCFVFWCRRMVLLRCKHGHLLATLIRYLGLGSGTHPQLSSCHYFQLLTAEFEVLPWAHLAMAPGATHYLACNMQKVAAAAVLAPRHISQLPHSCLSSATIGENVFLAQLFRAEKLWWLLLHQGTDSLVPAVTCWGYQQLQLAIRTCRSPQLSPRQHLFLTKHLADIAKQEVGQSMLHLLVTAMNDALEDLPSDPPFPAIRPPPVQRQAPPPATPAQAAADGAMPSSNVITGRRAARHWTPTAHEQQQESVHLLRQQEALCSDKNHAKMQAARQKLPAASKRQELLAQLSQHSVVVISGATGNAQCHRCSLTA